MSNNVFRLTPPEKTRFDFNGKITKACIEKLSDLVYDNGDPNYDAALDLLIINIEDLHRRAVARDELYAAIEELPVYESNSGELVHLSDIDAELDHFLARNVDDLVL